MKKRTFRGVTRKGRIEIDHEVAYRSWVRDLPDGLEIDIEVREHKNKRSLSQNARYWALLTVGAISLWEDESMKDSLHEELAHLILGLPPCPKTGLRRRMRTPKLNTSEFSRYMDLCAQRLIELGADLSEWDALAAKTEAA